MNIENLSHEIARKKLLNVNLICAIIFMLKAGIAQLVEQLNRNQHVGGSSPLAGSIFFLTFGVWMIYPDPFTWHLLSEISTIF